MTNLEELIHSLKEVEGVKAIVLGGSRAKGTHHAESDYDLGIYYDPESPPDIRKLCQIAKQLDDRRQDHLLTPLGEWGPWMNGGGWLKVKSLPVDLLYRDLNQVKAVFQECLKGQISISYQPGHPHGFCNSIYLAEIAVCQVLWDSQGIISELKEKTLPYPSALKKGTIEKFFWEADFSLICARKGIPYQDISYVAGCFFRTVCCLNQVLFAVNERYWMNEKRAVKAAASFPGCPVNYELRINEVFSSLEPSPKHLGAGVRTLTELIGEVSQFAFS